MAPTHDIHLTWPYPVPSGNAFVAGTWPVPGHGPWEKVPMSRIPGTDTYEIHLDVQEVEDISDYLDDDGYLHHELLEHHHAHDHSFHDNQTPSTPTSRRKRLSRFFGLSRSSSTDPNSAEKRHPDLPFHHQSKDGVILPLTREYRYQFKFVIDDEWKCDPNRHQVQDNEGHWNHELVVDLVEKIEQYPSSADRSRSSSLQSQHNGHAAEIDLAQDNPPVSVEQEAPVTEASSVDDATATPLSPPAPLVSDQSDSVTTNLTTQEELKSEDASEAALIFDERDDLGLSVTTLAMAQPLESDDNGHDDNSIKENTGNDAAKENVVTPQQEQVQQPHQEHTAPLAVDQDESLHETPAAEDPASSAAADSSAAEPDAHEDIFVNSSSVAVPLLEIAEHSFIVPTEPPSSRENIETLIEEDVASAAIDLHTAVTEPVESKTVEVAAEKPAPMPVTPQRQMSNATEEPAPTPTTPQRRMSYAAAVKSHVADEPKLFALQAASAEEKRDLLTNRQNNNNKSARAVLEVVTDATAASMYSQVPSPPLTPSNVTDDEGKNEALERVQENLPESFSADASVFLSPKSDVPSFKHLRSSENKTKGVEVHDDDGETFDVLNNHAPNLLESSSSSLVIRKIETKELPEQYPNMLWSFCKTTAVVSAAVVVIGLGLGRRRD